MRTQFLAMGLIAGLITSACTKTESSNGPQPLEAFQLSPGQFKSSVKRFHFSTRGKAKTDFACEKMGFQSYRDGDLKKYKYPFPVSSSVVQTEEGKFLAAGACYSQGADSKAIGVLARFNSDSSLDINFRPVVVSDLQRHCGYGKLEQDSNGSFYLGTSCAVLTNQNHWEHTYFVFKTNNNGELDNQFANSGKLQVGSVNDAFGGLAILPDGSLVAHFQESASPREVKFVNIDPKTGTVLQTAKVDQKYADSDFGGEDLDRPFYPIPDYSDLRRGFTHERILLSWSQGYGVTPGIAADISNFSDFASRRAMAIPHRIGYPAFLPGLMFTANDKKGNSQLDILRFKRNSSAYVVDPPSGSNSLLSEFWTFLPAGVVDPATTKIKASRASVNTSGKKTPVISPSKPANSVICKPQIGAWEGTILMTCDEFEGTQKQPVSRIIVSLDTDLNLNSTFAQGGLFRDEGSACTDPNSRILVTGNALYSYCNNVVDETNEDGSYVTEATWSFFK